jgi:hypothetical protein
MGEVGTIGVDLARTVFRVHGAAASGAVLVRKKLRRHQVLAFFSSQLRKLIKWRSRSENVLRSSGRRYQVSTTAPELAFRHRASPPHALSK